MKIRTKINASFIITFIVIAGIIAASMGLYTTYFVKNNIYSYLHSSSRARAEHVRTFLQDQKKTAVILAAASVYLDFLKEPITSKQYPVVKEKIIKRFSRTIDADSNLIEVDIIGLDGKILASSNPEEEGGDEVEDDYFIEGLKNTFIKDVYYLDNNQLSYAVSAPIKDSNGVTLGVSLLRYKPDLFYSIVKNENGLGDTEENFLINKEKFLITPSRFLNTDYILKQKINTQNANDCYNPQEVDYVNKNGYSGLIEKFGNQLVEALDYRNINVIATHAYIPETGWCLITKVDKADALYFRIPLTIVNFVIILVSIIIFSLIGFFLSRRITTPLKELERGTEKIKEGDLDYKVNINTKDEFGVLAEAFNSMTAEVKSSKNDIEQKVLEQTKEIKNKAQELSDQKIAILNILEDTENQKKKVEILADDLKKFKLALENASDQVVITDVEGIVVYGNSAVEKITGYLPEEAMGKKAGTLWKAPMPMEFYKNMWDVIKVKKKTFIGEIQNKRKNGEIYTANISISPVLDSEKNVVYFVAIEHDITHEKEVDKAKTEFVSLASHQLRTPLSAINWYTEILLGGDAGNINEDQKKYLNEIYTSSQRMVELVNSLLNVSRLDLGTFLVNPVPVDVPGLIKSLLTELQSQILEKKQIIKEGYDDNLPLLFADQNLLRMVLQNLLSNAVKYTPLGGSVTTEVKMVDNKFTIKISDTGIGIPKNQQDKIFMKLFRADNAKQSETEGTGLGLYIIKSIVDQSGGEVWFESVENKGTTFVVSFPPTGMRKKDGSKSLDM